MWLWVVAKCFLTRYYKYCNLHIKLIYKRFNFVRIQIDNIYSFVQRPQDILQLLLDAEVTAEGLEAISSDSDSQQTSEQHVHQMDKIVNFGEKKLSVEVVTNSSNLKYIVLIDQSIHQQRVQYSYVQEVKSSSTLFLMAGYETTGNALAFFSRQIARNPRVQQKLVEEIEATFADEVRWLLINLMLS